MWFSYVKRTIKFCQKSHVYKCNEKKNPEKKHSKLLTKFASKEGEGMWTRD